MIAPTRQGGRQEVVVAAFSGPAPGVVDASLEPPAEPIDFGFLLGSLGDDPQAAKETLDFLDRTFDVPVFAVPGGDDLLPVWMEAFAGRSGTAVDATGVDRITTSAGDFVLLPGAPHGRYARGRDACGYLDADVASLVERVGPNHEGSRWLVAWAAPRLAAGFEGAPGGSALVTRAARDLEVAGGLFAWPRAHAGDEPAEGRWVVTSIGRDPVEVATGTWVAPAWTVVRFRSGRAEPVLP